MALEGLDLQLQLLDQLLDAFLVLAVLVGLEGHLLEAALVLTQLLQVLLVQAAMGGNVVLQITDLKDKNQNRRKCQHER